MPKSDVDRGIARAFQMWADVTDLAFVHVNNQSADVDIDILYVYWYWFNEIISHYLAFIYYK